MANANEPVIESSNPVNPSVIPSQLEFVAIGISVDLALGASVEDSVAEGAVREMGLKEKSLPADKDDEQPAADQAATRSAQAGSSSDKEEIEGSGSSTATVLEGAAIMKKKIKKKEKLSSIKANNDA